ncbi:MAG: hypothetical protein ACQESO_07840 [Bacillota bacterium]
MNSPMIIKDQNRTFRIAGIRLNHKTQDLSPFLYPIYPNVMAEKIIIKVIIINQNPMIAPIFSLIATFKYGLMTVAKIMSRDPGIKVDKPTAIVHQAIFLVYL